MALRDGISRSAKSGGGGIPWPSYKGDILGLDRGTVSNRLLSPPCRYI